MTGSMMDDAFGHDVRATLPADRHVSPPAGRLETAVPRPYGANQDDEARSRAARADVWGSVVAARVSVEREPTR
jgi:hypothetical protein